MRGFFLALVTSVLLSACSSGGSTSTGGSQVGGNNAGSTGLIIYATLSMDSFSIDVSSVKCDYVYDPDNPTEVEYESPITTDTGTMTITVEDTSVVSTSSNKAVHLTDYTVSFQRKSSGSPTLTARDYSNSATMFLGDGGNATLALDVIIADLAGTKAEFRDQARDQYGFVYGVDSYVVTVTYRGRRGDTGEAVSVSATAHIEFGNFCN